MSNDRYFEMKCPVCESDSLDFELICPVDECFIQDVSCNKCGTDFRTYSSKPLWYIEEDSIHKSNRMML